MKTDIWMPIYIGDYIADTQHLNAEKHGIYLLLMMHYWKQGPLSNDIEELSCVSKSSEEKTKKILDKFFTLDGEVFRHKRIDKELANASSRSDAARANANKRWEMQRQCDGISDSISDGNATSDAKPMPEVCSSPSPSPSPISKPKIEPRKRFNKPTIEELKEYGESIGYNIDAQHFLDYHDMAGWRLKSGNKMADWKATVRTWKRNNFTKSTQKTSPLIQKEDYHKRPTARGRCLSCGKHADLKYGKCEECQDG